MVPKYYVDDDFAVSLVEESGFFRLKIQTPEVLDHHVEEFMDTTVEWLSSNPTKGILIDFDGVKAVCGDFAVQLHRYYADIKRRGLYVRFVNVDPVIEPYIDISNITVVLHDPIPDRTVVSAKEVLQDLADNLSNEELMEKHDLSKKGLTKMFNKLLIKGLISKSALADRLGVTTDEVTITLRGGKRPTKAVVNASEVLQDIADNMTDAQIMRKYKLSAKGLRSMMRKLYRRGLITKTTLTRRKGLDS